MITMRRYVLTTVLCWPVSADNTSDDNNGTSNHIHLGDNMVNEITTMTVMLVTGLMMTWMTVIVATMMASVMMMMIMVAGHDASLQMREGPGP